MGRIQQINPNNYGSSSQIHPEFENIIRYLVAAERGNKTLAEMNQALFDADGNVNLGVEFRYSADGLEMRVGEGDAWEVLANAADLRGAAGRDIGEVALPIITARTDVVTTAGQTVIPYTHNSTDTIFVHHNGVLLRPGTDYTTDSVADTVTLTTPAVADDVVTLYRVRGAGGVTVTRNFITVAAASQSVFGVALPTEDYQLQLYLNGILLAPDIDYVINDALQTITLLEAAVTNDVLGVITFQADDATTVPGFMLEGIFTDAATGLIPWGKISVGPDAIDPSKVDGLLDHIAESAKISIGSGTPSNPVSGDLWLDTSSNPAQLKFYDGTQFLSTAPSSTLPAIRTSDASYIVAINSTGTGFVYKPQDFSSLIYKTEKGAAGGVATLDNDGYLDPTQIPPVRTTDVISLSKEGAVANGTYMLRRLYNEKVRIVGLSVNSQSGTGTIQLKVAGVAVGASYSVASAANDQSFGTVIEVDALVISKTLEVEVSAGASLNGLHLTVVIERLN